ncbi:hypothetical protein BCV69DRAFT_295479 [Microstroma glucosiphilum]|uniref:Hyaluronan-mediated motility receptor C-terminal domain-containing protein n=1 Tax=Pseudomicrostroma glucosiphilum TaxID=1684307 RepID=A0A316TX95_9BASI|nr:hypothetical protein BCV69DRAFT_295479 [Pseudomicrostroma glucosiphilum]PWN18049.1 hypothetical protein BCV69DRAFT_295479 [Pseudomicrostroma glucosiphilum]
MLENRTPSAAGPLRSRATSSSRQPLTSSSHQANTLSSADQTITSKIAFAGEAAKQSRKLDEKLTRTQARLEEVEAEKHQLSRKNEDLATELRLAAQREAKLKAGLDKEKARGSVGGQGGLLAKLEELQKMHQDSKEKWKSSIAEVRKELEEEKKTGDKAQRRAGVALEEVKGLRVVEKEQAHKTKELEKKLAEERTKVEGIQFALAKAKDELASHQDDDGLVDQLEQNVELILKSALHLADQRHQDRSAQQDLRWSSRMALAERDIAVDECEAARAETANLMASNDELAEKTVSLGDQLKEAQSFSQQLLQQLDLTRADVSAQAPSDEAAPPCSCTLKDDSGESVLSSDLLQLTFLEEDVQLLTGRLCQTQTDLDSLHESHLALLRSSKEDSDAVCRLRAQLASSQTQLEKVTEEKVQLESVQSRLATALEDEKVRGNEEEKRRRTVETEKRNMEENARAAVREAAMMREKVRGEEEEKAELLESLASTAHYQQMYTTLLSTSHTLLHRLQASEADLHSLSEENMLLASHSNPTQKILYLDGLRRRLAESRDEVGFLKDEEGKLRERVKTLESEVRVMKGLEGGKGGRVRRIVSAGVGGKKERRRSSALMPVAYSSHPAPLQVQKSSAVPQPKGRARPSRVSLLPSAPATNSSVEAQDDWSSDEEERDDSSSMRRGDDEEFTMHELTYGSPRK